MLTNPLPPVADDDLLADIRDALDLKPTDWTTTKFASDMGNSVIEAKAEMRLTAAPGGIGYFQRDNPLLRHVVLRKRRDLERLGLIPVLPVDVHPNMDSPPPSHLFNGLSLYTSDAFDTAYQAVGAFTKAYAKRDKPAGFMRTLLSQRLCSSQAAAIATARALMGDGELDDEVPEELDLNVFECEG